MAEPQLSLPLDVDCANEDALRLAWESSGLQLPYHIALSNPALAICLRCLADARQRKSRTNIPGYCAVADGCPARDQVASRVDSSTSSECTEIEA
jgi:hypothetical protein